MSEEVTIQANGELPRSIEITLERYGLGIESAQVYPSITVDFGTIAAPTNIHWSDIIDAPDIDEVPTQGSENLVESGGVYQALRDLIANGGLFGGEVAPDSQPPHGSDYRYYYIARQEGTYFGSITIDGSYLNIIYWNNSWIPIPISLTGNGLAEELAPYLRKDELYTCLGFLAFSTSINYSVGETVVYYGKLYVFTENHSAGAWDIDDVEEIDLFAYLDGETSKIYDALGEIDNIKADKVSNATSGNIAALDSEGNLVDSGVSPSDFIAMPSGGTTGQVLKKTAQGVAWRNDDDTQDTAGTDKSNKPLYLIGSEDRGGALETFTSDSAVYMEDGALVASTFNGYTLGAACEKSVDNAITGGSQKLPTSDAVYLALRNKADSSTTLAGYGITDAYTKTQVDNKMSRVYKAAGSAASVAALGSLDAEHEGYVYNMTAAFTTTSDFVEGAGNTYPAGTNVVICKREESRVEYKYDVLAGFVDLSGYAEKSEMSVTDGTGVNVDKTTIQLKSGTSATVLKTHQDISGKADKNVTPTILTVSNIAELTSAQVEALRYGDIVVAEEAEEWTDGLPKVHFVTLKLEDECYLDTSLNGVGTYYTIEYIKSNGAWEYVTTETWETSDFLQRVESATLGHFPALNARGEIFDSGKSASDFVENPSGGSVGQVLKKTASGTEWANETMELPSIAGNGGKVLKVNSGATAVEWANESGGSSTDVQVNGSSITNNGVANIVTETAYNASTNKIATMSDLPSVSGLESASNKVTSISSSSTDTEYPSAKCVYDIVGDIETLLAAI